MRLPDRPDWSENQLEDLVSPEMFFRISRKTLIHHAAIKRINSYLNSRLVLELNPEADWKTIVSRERVGAFKDWLDR